MPKETGIIMSGSHPVDILEGRKTMTRRVIKLNRRTEWLLNPDVGWSDEYIKDPDNSLVAECPYGGVGDRLWVKETWATEKRLDHLSPSQLGNAADVALWYKADSDQHSLLERGKWRPSIFMPRWASRILREITEVRVERVQEITNEDAKAEGVTPMTCCLPGAAHYITPFKELWDSLNAKRGYPWANNDWVWPIRFRMIEQ